MILFSSFGPGGPLAELSSVSGSGLGSTLGPAFRGAIAGLLGIVLLLVGADRFVAGAAAVSRKLGVSPFIIGMFIIGLGTSAPELLVSMMAAGQGNAGIAVGNVLGSNVSNVALVLGATVLVAPVSIHRQVLGRELPKLIAATLLAGAALADLRLASIDAALLFAGLLVIMVRMFLRHRRGGVQPSHAQPSQEASTADGEVDASLNEAAAEDATDAQEEGLEEIPDTSPGLASLWLILGLVFLVGGSRAVVWGGTTLAHEFGVDDLIIGVTLVALGTSLPELASSIVAALRREHELAIGNVIGSNLINLLLVLPASALVRHVEVAPLAMRRDYVAVFATSVLLWLLVRMGRQKDGTARVGRRAGGVLIAAYIGYIVSVAQAL